MYIVRSCRKHTRVFREYCNSVPLLIVYSDLFGDEFGGRLWAQAPLPAPGRNKDAYYFGDEKCPGDDTLCHHMSNYAAARGLCAPPIDASRFDSFADVHCSQLNIKITFAFI